MVRQRVYVLAWARARASETFRASDGMPGMVRQRRKKRAVHFHILFVGTHGHYCMLSLALDTTYTVRAFHMQVSDELEQGLPVTQIMTGLDTVKAVAKLQVNMFANELCMYAVCVRVCARQHAHRFDREYTCLDRDRTDVHLTFLHVTHLHVNT